MSSMWACVAASNSTNDWGAIFARVQKPMKSLQELTNDQLRDLLEALHGKVKDARKKSVQAIAKHEDLQKKWIANLSALPAGSPEEAEARRQEAFDVALAKYPEAFIHHKIMAHLGSFERACREEQIERSKRTKEDSKKKV